MKSVVLGKVIENTYLIDQKTTIIKDEHGKDKKVFTAKPVLNKKSEVKEWREILRFDGEPRYNKPYSSYILFSPNTLNISEDEVVEINNEIFRADLNELHLKTDKILEEIDIDKEATENKFNKCINSFNEAMIKSNKAMQDYCDLHGLKYWKTDCEKVFSIVYPDKEYEIKDGKMVCKEVSVEIVLKSDYGIGSLVDTACCASTKSIFEF